MEQIKEFIKQTHEKIKQNYSKNKKNFLKNNLKPIKAPLNKRYSTPKNISKLRKNKSTDYIQANYLNEEYSKDFTHGEISKRSKDDFKNNEQNTNSKNYYENIIQKPKIIKESLDNLKLQKNMFNNINNKISASVKRGKIKLPSISKKQ